MTKQQQQEFMKLPSIVMLTDGSGNKDTKGWETHPESSNW